MNTAQLAVLLWATVTIAGVLLLLAYMWGAPIFLIAAIAVAAAGLIYALRPHPDARKGVVIKAVLIASGITCLIGLVIFKDDIWPSGIPWPHAPAGSLQSSNLNEPKTTAESLPSQPSAQTPASDTFQNIELPLDQIKLSKIVLSGWTGIGGKVHLKGRIANRSQHTIDELVIRISLYDKEEKLAEASVILTPYRIVGQSSGPPIKFPSGFGVPPGESRDFEQEVIGIPQINQPLESLRVIYIVNRATCSDTCYYEAIRRQLKDNVGSR
jgi:hypothetical protein